MGICDTEELDNLAGVPILDVTELPPACPKCLEALEEEDLEYDTCRVCGADISEVPR